MPSPSCLVKDGGGGAVATTGGLDITPGNVIVASLISTAGVNLFGFSCLNTDDTLTPAAINAGIVIDPVLKTATFTATSLFGTSMIFESVVENGLLNGVAYPPYREQFILHTLSRCGQRVFALMEQGQCGSNGWTTKLNALRRAFVDQKLASNFTTTLATAQNTNFTFAALANEVWEVDFEGTAQCSGVGGSAYALAAPSGATIEGWLDSSLASVTSKSYQRLTVAGTLTSTAVHTVATTPAPDRLRAVVSMGATPGNITLQAASITGGQTTTIFAGARLSARRLVGV